MKRGPSLSAIPPCSLLHLLSGRLLLFLPFDHRRGKEKTLSRAPGTARTSSFAFISPFLHNYPFRDPASLPRRALPSHLLSYPPLLTPNAFCRMP